jgi:hypothetical protein
MLPESADANVLQVWTAVGGMTVIVHFLSEWSEHLQDQFMHASERVRREDEKTYRCGIRRCFRLAAAISGSKLATTAPACLNPLKSRQGPVAFNEQEVPARLADRASS